MFDGAITNRSGQRCFPKCALMVTIQKIRRRKRIASTEQPQFIVEVLAPTFGDTGDGVKKIGAVLSWGSRAAPILSGLLTYKYEDFVNHNSHSRRCEKLHPLVGKSIVEISGPDLGGDRVRSGPCRW